MTGEADDTLANEHLRVQLLPAETGFGG